MEKRWASINLTISEVENGLVIDQAGERYLAREWRLSDEVVSVIDRAIASGLGCIIQDTSPQRNRRLPVNECGVEYIGFSQRPEECRVFVLDQYSLERKKDRRHPTQVTFAKHYRGVPDSAGVPFADERGGGKNVFVPIVELDAALAACGAGERARIEATRRARDWKRARDESLGITSEDLLEAWIMAEWKTFPFGRRLTRIRNQMPANGYSDLLAEDPRAKAEVIFELKRGIADAKVIREQLTRYVVHRRQDSPEVWGAVVARDFSTEAYEAAGETDFPLELYRFHDTHGNFRLEKIWGDWQSLGANNSMRKI